MPGLFYIHDKISGWHEDIYFPENSGQSNQDSNYIYVSDHNQKPF